MFNRIHFGLMERSPWRAYCFKEIQNAIGVKITTETSAVADESLER